MSVLWQDIRIGALCHGAAAYDERTGAELPTEKVKRARGRELEKMAEHNVKTDISWEEAKRRGLKIVKCRWVDGWKPLPDDPHGVRSRCVAQEVNTGPRDDVHSGTPPLKAHRMVVSSGSTRKKGSTKHARLIGRYDISVAFCHAFSTGRIAVILPADVYEGSLWFLNKAMNGTREASKMWCEYVTTTMVSESFVEVPSVPGLFYSEDLQATVSCHGDDFLAEGEAKDLDRLDLIMMKHFETKILPRIGPEEFGGEINCGSHLHRIIRWTGTGYSWEADPKYAKLITEELGLTGAKGVDSPTSKDTGRGDRHADDPLNEEEANSFRKIAGTALYLSLDRPSIQFALSEITSSMSKPTRLHELRLKRLGRYLISYPREVWMFDIQDLPTEHVVYTDSDWASDKRTRKSMSSYTERFGQHLIDSSCARQSVIALSSGEAEFYALTRGAAAGIMSKRVWQIIGYANIGLKIKTDSTAAKGIASRKGVGKVKHLSLKELWVQDYLQRGEFTVEKEPTVSNWADLNTKSLSGPRIAELLRNMPIKRGLQAACLLSCLLIAQAQDDEEQVPSSDSGWSLCYIVMTHILAIYGIITLLWKLMCQRRCITKDQGTQTEREEQNRSIKAEGSDQRVYVAGNGTKYHQRWCQCITKPAPKSRITHMYRNQAIQNGFTACRICMAESSSG